MDQFSCPETGLIYKLTRVQSSFGYKKVLSRRGGKFKKSCYKYPSSMYNSTFCIITIFSIRKWEFNCGRIMWNNNKHHMDFRHLISKYFLCSKNQNPVNSNPSNFETKLLFMECKALIMNVENGDLTQQLSNGSWKDSLLMTITITVEQF